MENYTMNYETRTNDDNFALTPSPISAGYDGGGIMENCRVDCSENGEVNFTKLEIEQKLHRHDPEISLRFPGKTKSNVWNLFRIIVYKNVRQDFVTCLECHCVLAYKSRTGTASLLRHNCYKKLLTEIANVRNLHLNVQNETMLNGHLDERTMAIQGLSHNIKEPYTQLNIDEDHTLTIKCEPDDDISFLDNPEVKSEDTYYQSDDDNYDDTLHDDYTTNDLKIPTIEPLQHPHNQQQHHQQPQQQQQQPQQSQPIHPAQNISYTFVEENQLSKFDLEEKLRIKDENIMIVPQHKMKSDIWKRFEVIYYRNVKQNYVQCIGCHCILSYKKKTGSASLIRHKCNFRRKMFFGIGRPESSHYKTDGEPPAKKQQQQQQQQIPLIPKENFPNDKLSTYLTNFSLPPSTSSTTTSAQNSVPKQRLTELAIQQIYFICRDLGSAEIFDNQTFRQMMQILLNIGADYGRQNIDDILSSGQFINTMLKNMQIDIRNNIKNVIEISHLSLTFDLWQHSNQNLITVVGYVINENYELKKFNLGTTKLNLILTKDNIYAKVLGILYRYVDNPEELLKRSILIVDSNDDLISQTFLENKKILCSCKQIELILQNSVNLENVSITQNIDEINKLLNYLREYNGALDPRLNNLTNLEFVETNSHWKNKLNILKMISDNFDQLTEFLSSINKLNFLENLDLSLIRNYLGLFQPFQICIERLCADEQTTTLNEVYLWKKKLEKNCQIFEDEKVFTKFYKEKLLNLIQENFHITQFHRIALFLNPNFKNLKFLTTIERETVIDDVRKCIDDLILENKLNAEITQSAAAAVGNDSDDDEKLNSGTGKEDEQKFNIVNDIFLEFMDCSVPDIEEDISKEEIRLYLDFKLAEPKTPLEFWKVDNPNIKFLRKLAKKILSIPSCSVTSTLQYSENGKNLCTKRQTLKMDDLDCMIFLHQNV